MLLLPGTQPVAQGEWMHCIFADEDGRSNSAGVAGPRRRVPSFVPDMAHDEEPEPWHVEELLTSEDEASSPEREVPASIQVTVTTAGWPCPALKYNEWLWMHSGYISIYAYAACIITLLLNNQDQLFPHRQAAAAVVWGCPGRLGAAGGEPGPCC